MKKNLIMTIAIFVLSIGSLKSQVVWGVRAGYDFLNGQEYFADIRYIGNFGLEVGPVIYYAFNNKFYLNTGIMLGFKIIDEMRYDSWDERYYGKYFSRTSEFISVNVPLFMGYHYHVMNNISLFIQAGPFVESNIRLNRYEGYSNGISAGLGGMAGINIRRIKIEVGHFVGFSNYLFTDKTTFGVSYTF